MNIPSREECLDILKKNKAPSKVIEHSKTVCKIAEEITNKLIQKGIKINKELVIAAALLHDVERVKENHVLEGVKLLKKMGFLEVSRVIGKHSLYNLDDDSIKPTTYEEKIVFYADKRVIETKIVGIKERFEDIERRYNVKLDEEFEFTKKIEEELIK